MRSLSPLATKTGCSTPDRSEGGCSPCFDGFELRKESRGPDVLVAIVLSFLQPLKERSGGRPTVCRRREEEVELRIPQGQCAFCHIDERDAGDLVDAFASSGARARKDDLSVWHWLNVTQVSVSMSNYDHHM